MKQAVESAGYHIAAGIGFREKKCIEMNSLVTEAEKQMYEDKESFYSANGIDHKRKR